MGVCEIGKNDSQRLIRLGYHADRLISKKDKLDKSTSKRKKTKAKRIDKAIARILRKIKNLRNELHKKTRIISQKITTWLSSQNLT